MENTTLKFKWTTSKAADTYGYNVCTLYANDIKVSKCNGGGYDMEGTCLGSYIANAFNDELLKLNTEYYGLSFHDPTFDPGKVKVEHAPVFGKDEDAGKTIEELETENKSLGLERYQAFYSASSKIPTEKHIIPLIDGACGISSVERIINAIGYELQFIDSGKNQTIRILQKS